MAYFNCIGREPGVRVADFLWGSLGEAVLCLRQNVASPRSFLWKGAMKLADYSRGGGSESAFP